MILNAFVSIRTMNMIQSQKNVLRECAAAIDLAPLGHVLVVANLVIIKQFLRHVMKESFKENQWTIWDD
jgi:hypothetical protein